MGDKNHYIILMEVIKMEIFESVGRVVSKINWRAVGTVCLVLIGGATVLRGVADMQVKQELIDSAVARQLADAIAKAASEHHN